MEETSITSYALATMCRLCLSRGEVTMFDVFSFLPRFKNRVADVIMKCAPVQILRCDEMPKFICRLCYSQLEKSYQFQMQAVQSDKTIRRHLEQLNAFDKKLTLEYCNQRPSEDPFIDNINENSAETCTSLELHGVFDSNVNWTEQEYGHFISAKKSNDEMSLKSEITDEQINDNSVIAPDCADETEGVLTKVSQNIGDSNLAHDINWKLEGSGNILSTCTTDVEMSLKYAIKNEPIDGSALILAGSIVDTLNSSFSDGVSEISCEDTKIGIDPTADTACIRSAYAEDNFKKCEKKSTSLKRKHISEKLFQCNVCHKYFIRASKLEIHKRIHTGERPYHCDVCSQSFTELGNLKAHKRIHTGEKPYQCDVCSKCFNQSNKLKAHTRIHTGERPYQCDVCNKCFIESSHLKVHKRTHTGEKPNQCDVCNKCFNRSGDLKVHRRIHSGERPYQCDVCNKCFIQSSKLKVHKRIHTDEKPYQCNVCKKHFTQLSYLNTHKLCHTEVKPYKCDVCNKCFALLSRLNRHKSVHIDKKT